MPPEHARAFGSEGGAVNPLGLAITLVGIVLLLVLPRRYAIVPFLFVVFLVPGGQGLVLGGAHFFLSRLLILAGLIRLMGAKRKRVGNGKKSIDRLFVGCYIAVAIATTVLFLDVSAFINQIAATIDTIGAYFFLRFCVQNEQDVVLAIKCLAIVMCVIAVGMTIEHVTVQNVFSYVGSSKAAPEIRDNKIRAQGPFRHTLTAGTFAGTALPLMLILWGSGRSRLLAALGALAATVIMLATNSSTPLIAYLAGLGAMSLWSIRKRMRLVRRGIVAALLVLSVVMKAPVWFLIAHVDLTGSSSSYHRAVIVDAFIKHFTDWCLVGAKDTGSWGWDVWDAQNQFVSIGETGGLVALVFFIAAITRCFSRLGTARSYVEGDPTWERNIWFIGSALFAHIVGFFGVNYFDQSNVNWVLLLAIITAVTAPILAPGRSVQNRSLRSIPSGEILDPSPIRSSPTVYR